MKILVYGAGVIGSYLIHMLCLSGNDVSVVARKEWARTLESKGLCITHTLQRKETVDHPRIIRQYDHQDYDIVFSVMQQQQQKELASQLRPIHTKLLIFVGNNLDPKALSDAVTDKKACPHRDVLFGFQSTGGLRKKDRVLCVHWKKGGMVIGGLHTFPSVKAKQLLNDAFLKSGYQVKYMDDMEGWLRCHMAFILPIVYISYRYQCNLRKAGRKDLKCMMDAAGEGYGLLVSIGTKIRPEGDDSWYQKGLKRSFFEIVLLTIAKTTLGELVATDHCQNAVSEMEYMDQQFQEIRAKHPEYLMPSWDRLYEQMPSWSEIHQRYDVL